MGKVPDVIDWIMLTLDCVSCGEAKVEIERFRALCVPCLRVEMKPALDRERAEDEEANAIFGDVDSDERGV